MYNKYHMYETPKTISRQNEKALAGVCLRTYLVHSTYIFLYLGFGIPVLGEAHNTISTICTKHQKLFPAKTKKTNTTLQLYGTPK